MNQIIAENSHINWTYEKKLKLESMLLMVSHPAMCMDSSPIAGLAIHLQHQMLSCRSIQLNPLKNKCASSKTKLIEMNVSNDLDEDNLFMSTLSDEPQTEPSKIKVCFKRYNFF